LFLYWFHMWFSILYYQCTSIQFIFSTNAVTLKCKNQLFWLLLRWGTREGGGTRITWKRDSSSFLCLMLRDWTLLMRKISAEGKHSWQSLKVQSSKRILTDSITLFVWRKKVVTEFKFHRTFWQLFWFSNGTT
jgi:hypothetical protein